MISYIGWTFYISEPIYTNNCTNKQLEKFDYVSIPYYRNEVQNGLVLQVDSNKALLKVTRFSSDDFYELDLKNRNFRVVGKGTLYHKVNEYIGFNIMRISQIFIMILIAIVIITLISILTDLLK